MDQQAAYSDDQKPQYQEDAGNVGLQAESEDHGKRSVLLKKVKAKAKKIKDKLQAYGYNNDQQKEARVPDDHDLDEEDDKKEVVDPQIHESSAMKSEVSGQELGGPGTPIGRSRAADEYTSRTPEDKVTDYATETGSVPGPEGEKDQQLGDLATPIGRSRNADEDSSRTPQDKVIDFPIETGSIQRPETGIFVGGSRAINEDSSRIPQEKVTDFPTETGSFPEPEGGKDQELGAFATTIGGSRAVDEDSSRIPQEKVTDYPTETGSFPMPEGGKDQELGDPGTLIGKSAAAINEDSSGTPQDKVADYPTETGFFPMPEGGKDQELRGPGTFIGKSTAINEDSSRTSQDKVTDFPTETGSFPMPEGRKDQELGGPGTLIGKSTSINEDSSRTPQDKVIDFPIETGSIPVQEEGKNQDLGGPGTFIGRSTAMDEDSSRTPHAIATDYPNETGSFPGQEEAKDQLKLDVVRTGQIKEVPDAPANTPAAVGLVEHKESNDPIKSLVQQQQVNRAQAAILSEGLEEDSNSLKDGRVDSSNNQTEVTDPSIAGSKEAGISSILRSFDDMNVNETKAEAEQSISAESRGFSSDVQSESHDQSSPDFTPTKSVSAGQEIPEPIQQGAHSSEVQEHPSEEIGEKPSNQGSYTGKISSATSAVADKAISAKNIVASKLGYGQVRPETEERQEPAKGASTMEYGKKIATTVTEKLSPVYQKVTETGSNVISKVPGMSSGTGNVSDRSVEGQEKGVSVKDYVAEKLRPGEEDRALSEVISETLHKRKDNGENAGKPAGKVTAPEKVDESGEPSPGKGVVDKLKGAVGSWFGKGQVTAPSDQPHGSTTETEGSKSSTVGEEFGERRLQESGN